MQLIQQLGAEIESLWLEKNYNEDDLPAIAAEALKAADLPAKLDAWDVIAWTLQQSELPPQRDLKGNFGDPPITVYSGARFHIDVYFWFEGTTSIHQHGFCGAFQVFMGSSIHSWYEFEEREAVNTFCRIGQMKLKVCEILEVGAIQPIWGGKQYIHSLFHLEQPSATIVVRTDRSPLNLPQFNYHKPGFAVDPFFEHAATTKKLQAMSALLRAKRPDADSQIIALLESADLHTSFLILTHLRGMLRHDQLHQMFNPEGTGARFDQMLDTVRKRHPVAGDTLGAVFEQANMIDDIIRRRSYVTDPEQRFFLALLLNVDGRDRILSLISQRFADADPIEKILDWTFDLAQIRIVGLENSNALGIPNFGEPELFVLEHILKGKSDDEIAAEFMAENPSADVMAFIDALARIRNAVIFSPLL